MKFNRRGFIGSLVGGLLATKKESSPPEWTVEELPNGWTKTTRAMTVLPTTNTIMVRHCTIICGRSETTTPI